MTTLLAYQARAAGEHVTAPFTVPGAGTVELHVALPASEIGAAVNNGIDFRIDIEVSIDGGATWYVTRGTGWKQPSDAQPGPFSKTR